MHFGLKKNWGFLMAFFYNIPDKKVFSGIIQILGENTLIVLEILINLRNHKF